MYLGKRIPGDVDPDLYHSKPDLRIRADINLIPNPRYDPRQKKKQNSKGILQRIFQNFTQKAPANHGFYIRWLLFSRCARMM